MPRSGVASSKVSSQVPAAGRVMALSACHVAGPSTAQYAQ
jgi:hypothetical protein